MAYSGVFVFGDSLVDPGNALKLAQWYGGLPLTDLPEGAPTADKGYFQGRFSNGYTFADLLSNKYIGIPTKTIFPYFFEDPWIGVKIAPFASDPSGNNLNFAYGGSHIRQGDEVVPDLDGQTDAFRHAVDGEADPNALYIITTGGNDVRDLALTGEDPVPRDQAYAELQRCADKMLTELSQLIEIGAQDFVITGIADVGLIPRYDRDGNGVLDPTEQMRSDAATEYSVYLDNLIRTEVVPALQALGATVTYVPLMDYVDENGNVISGALSANLPMIAALHGLTTEELENNLLQYKNLIFFDQIHPNAQANALLGAFMQSHIDGTPWVETMPLAGADVDYRLAATIGSSGEVDKMIVLLVAGTTYTFEMLGTSSLGTPGTLADPTLRLMGPAGNVIGQNDDSGPGFDATLTFIASATGSYTVELDAVGSLTGSYTLQAAVIDGPAMTSGNTYVVNSGSTVVIESVDGIGTDIVKASVSYALATGSEIEILRTTSDKGKTALNLAGNEFDQTIVGNSGSNVIDGKGGNDLLTGGGGADKFAFTASLGGGIDRISDFNVRDDTITLDDAVFTGLGLGALAAGAFARGALATQSDDRIIYDPSSGKLYFDVDGVGGAAQVQFAVLGTGLNLTAADFYVV